MAQRSADARGRTAWRTGAGRIGRALLREPPGVARLSGEASFLAVAIVVQWLAVGALAAAARHNGWLYYQGGDQTFFYTISWILSHGHLPVTGIGYAWSLLEAPVSLAAGPSFLRALPGIVAIQVVLMLPLALLAFYGAVKRVLGPVLARVGVIAWIAAPYAVIPLFVARYHERWVSQTLPQVQGLTGMGDFASMVVVLCAAYLFLRHLDEDGWETAALAGLVTGFAIGLKPSTSLFLAAPAAGFLVARRWRSAAVTAAGLALPLLTLAVWKQRGLGTLPILSSHGGAAHLAAGAGAVGAGAVGGLAVHRYVNLDWNHLGTNLDQIREFFWSNRVVEWLPVAGALGAFRRSWARGAFLTVWIAAYVVVKGTASVASVESASFWRLLAPAWPAYLLLALAVVALVPTVGGRLGATRPAPAVPRAFRRTLVAAVVVLGAVPLVLATALPRDLSHRALRNDVHNLYVPVDPSFVPALVVDGRTVTVSWSGPGSGSTRTTYLVLRARSTGGPRDGLSCNTAPVPDCSLRMDELGYRTSRFVDRPGPGRWIYRIAQAASYTKSPGEGDPLLYSAPAVAVVR